MDETTTMSEVMALRVIVETMMLLMARNGGAELNALEDQLRFMTERGADMVVAPKVSDINYGEAGARGLAMIELLRTRSGLEPRS